MNSNMSSILLPKICPPEEKKQKGHFLAVFIRVNWKLFCETKFIKKNKSQIAGMRPPTHPRSYTFLIFVLLVPLLVNYFINMSCLLVTKPYTSSHGLYGQVSRFPRWSEKSCIGEPFSKQMHSACSVCPQRLHLNDIHRVTDFVHPANI